jgi:hypothetical protein
MMSNFDTFYNITFYLPSGGQRRTVVKSWTLDERTNLLHWWDKDGKMFITNLPFEIEELERI